MNPVSTLKPGLLVSIATKISGGVNYTRQDLDATKEGKTERASWQTERTIIDADEFQRATEVRQKCRNLIVQQCVASSFGLLCPSDNEAELFDAIRTARMFAEDFNRDSRYSKVSVYALAGRVARDDVEAARAISAEVRDLMSDMQAGIAAADVNRIRKAASEAKRLGSMLSEDAAGKVNEAIAQARSAARQIVKLIEQDGEAAATVVAELKTAKIEAARFAFLDMSEGEAQAAPEVARALEIEMVDEAEATEHAEALLDSVARDLEMGSDVQVQAAPAPVRSFDLF